MVQILPPGRTKKTTGQKLSEGIGRGLETAEQYYKEYTENESRRKKLESEDAALAQMGIDLRGIEDPKLRQAYVSASLQGANQQQLETMKQQFKTQQIKQKQDFISEILGGRAPQEMQEEPLQQTQETSSYNPSYLSDESILQANAMDPTLGRALQMQKDTALRQEDKKEKKFQTERQYHSSYSKEHEKQADVLRESIPKKKMALDFARNALETGDLGYFSLDKLADVTGIDLFRTAKGAQLATASKENLLNNMGRVSARAQNIWFEQRLNSMFPKIGQSKEANLTVQEMLEGEVALDNAYLTEYDRVKKEDEDNYGFVKKDASERARSNIKPFEKQILARTSYRMKEVEEQEKGLSRLKQEVGKNVAKGTPLTLAMAKLYKEKFGDKALDVAEKNGYKIPTIEDFKIYQSPIDKFFGE